MTPLTHIEAIQLLEQLIATPSPSREEDATATLLAEFLQKQGITPHRHHNNVWAYTKNYNPQKPTLLLNSHHDTVKPWVNEDADNTTEDPVFSPFEPVRKDGKLYGLGSNDAGASLVSLITTFCNYYTTPLPFNLVLLLSAEEEISGPKGLRSILPVWKERNINIDMAIVGEPTEMQAAIGERGLVVVDAYAKRRYHGNLADLFEPGHGPLFAPWVVDNDRFPADWYEKTSTCSKNCTECNYCESVRKQVFILPEM